MSCMNMLNKLPVIETDDRVSTFSERLKRKKKIL